jgi:hypothetical protein
VSVATTWTVPVTGASSEAIGPLGALGALAGLPASADVELVLDPPQAASVSIAAAMQMKAWERGNGYSISSTPPAPPWKFTVHSA